MDLQLAIIMIVILLRRNVKCVFKRLEIEASALKNDYINTTMQDNDQGKVFVLIPVIDQEEKAPITDDDDDVEELAHAEDDTSIADALRERVKVLCLVMTSPDHDVKAIHVKQTWGKRCNKLIFFSTQGDAELPAIKVEDSAQNSWKMMKEAHRYIYQNHLFDADWFLQADDLTYVILENLRYMLMNHNTTEPIYFGSSVKGPAFYMKQVFRSSRAGIVLSREALTRLIVETVQGRKRCYADPMSVDDEQMARCLSLIGVKAVDTRDPYQRGRLFPDNPHNLLIPKIDHDWYWTNIHRGKTGRGCCSEQAVTFHYVPSSLMYVLEYFIYHLRPFGISYNYDTHYNFRKYNTKQKKSYNKQTI
ncbi:glycoprotein-N-acetylgalactosamine 3-beta-galactosyltransferase 1-like [Plodia interpunctella]|uniref:glycoprotein-N-acetylgalactosamine 3-beta-galactosyltransferase 1-like n=1 Tax=Plodia interpunctella TaxID=58824 RepID=UPI0023677117|nr:glycoprotein-N-acetylgalactosamine 3-beta-galactosyltransferase 1-like [Plodia interpunctella]